MSYLSVLVSLISGFVGGMIAATVCYAFGEIRDAREFTRFTRAQRAYPPPIVLPHGDGE